MCQFHPKYDARHDPPRDCEFCWHDRDKYLDFAHLIAEQTVNSEFPYAWKSSKEHSVPQESILI